MNKIGIIGLGLIGGSMAKAIKKTGKYSILAYDIDEEVVKKAIDEKVVDETLTDENMRECQLILLALYPEETVKFIKNKKAFINPATLVIDCSGTKRKVCRELEPLAAEEGFRFIGGHPMAGIEFSGYDYSKQDLFKGASMILCMDESDEKAGKVKEFFIKLGFGKIVFTTAEDHDKIIAYTSQLAHVASNAFVKSPVAEMHKGFSAGSYLDLTRVAKLNPTMWSQLFLENKDYLLEEIEGFIGNLKLYKEALKDDDLEKLHKLLEEGSRRKESIDR